MNRRCTVAALAAALLVTGLVSFLPATAADSAVDRLVARFDELTLTGLDGWRVSPDLKTSPIAGDAPAQPSFDDSAWATLKIDERLYADSVWLRRRVVIPETVAGMAVDGPLTLKLTVNDYGFLWINGKELGRFDWNGSFALTDDARPGEVFDIAIKVVNTAGALQLLRADLLLEEAAASRQEINDFALSLRVGQKLLGFDTYQTNARQKVDPGIDRSTADRAEKQRLNALLQEIAAEIDTRALEAGDLARYRASVDAARARLAPIRDFVRTYTLFFAANAHIDAAWLWREGETIAVCKNTFASVMNMSRARTDFSYTQSSAAYYDWMERLYPELFGEIKARIGEGRWEVVGGMWVEPDCNLPSGTSWARQLLYGKRYFRQKLGVDVTIGWNPDSFGYNWNMPQFYRSAGIDAFITQKIGWNEKNVFPHRAFWWEGPDGSRILSYFPFDYVNTIDDPVKLVDWLRQHDANTGFRKMFVLFGVGNHGGGPSIEMMGRIDRLKTLDIYPSIDFGTAGEYLGWIKQQDLTKLPVWRDELYLEYHQGTFTTQAKTKEANRRSETLLTGAEAFSAIAALSGRPYGGARLEAAWRDVMFNQFHDILPGSSIREVYLDAAERYREAEALAGHELSGALDHLAGQVDTSRLAGEPVVVFNPLGWERSGLVRVPLPAGDEAEVAVFDAAGRELTSQVVATGTLAREVLFIAPNVPSLGYATYELRRKPPGTTPAGTLTVTESTLENDAFRVALDPASGWIRSLVDKRSGREVLAGPANRLQLLEDKPEAWDAWNVGLTGTEYPSTLRSIEIVERGPVRAVLRVKRDFLAPGTKKEAPTEDFPSSFFTQDIVLYAGSERIDFVTRVDWWEQKTMLKVAFPVAVTSDVATFEIPNATIERSTRLVTPQEQAQVEVPAQRWADLSQPTHGVSLLNAAKYGYDVKGNTLRLSLLRSPVWPDPTADRGKHVIEYALYPHAKGWREAGTVRRGYELDHPLLAARTGRHAGPLPAAQSFVRLEPGSLVLTSIKKAEDSAAWVVQWYDAHGDGAAATLTLPVVPVRAVVSDFLEADGAPLATEGRTVKAPTGRRATVTVKVALPPG